MNLELAAASIPKGRSTYAEVAAVLGPAIRATTKIDVDGVLKSLEYFGVITRPVGAGGPRGVRDVLRSAPAARTEQTCPQRQPTRVALIDEFGDTKDWPIGPKADAERGRIIDVKKRRRGAELLADLEYVTGM